MMTENRLHTFVICAYKESPYLEECILSLKAQTLQTGIIMVTSTPNAHISALSEKYGIPLSVNKGEGGIVQDWNFGYAMCRTKYITIAHQDDIYLPEYAERAVAMLEASKKPLIFFTDYAELRDGIRVDNNQLLKVKRLLLSPLKVRAFRGNKWIRRRSLSLGCGICCPSVTFAVRNLPDQVFTVQYRSCEDWQAWERISRIKGEFLYCPKILMAHRIHEESATTNILQDNGRTQEDYEMFCKFWPKWIAKLLVRFYSKSEESNQMG